MNERPRHGGTHRHPPEGTAGARRTESPAAGSASGAEFAGIPPRARSGEPVRRMEIHRGVAVSPGVVFGRVLVLDSGQGHALHRSIPADAVTAEVSRLDEAIKASISDLRDIHRKAEQEMGREAARIFLFHAGMLGDKKLIGPMRRMIEVEHVGAEYAVSQTLGALASKFAQIPDPAFTTKVNDIEDLEARLVHHLVGERGTRVAGAEAGTVVVARDLTPSQAAAFDRKRIIGFATDLGGRTGHTAIVARALGLPAVVGCQDLVAAARDGDPVILDGERGIMILHPDAPSLADYRAYGERSRMARESLADVARQKSVTLDGTHIEIVGNIEFPEESTQVFDAGGEGIGLYRTEYLYLTGKGEPTEADHFRAYKRLIELAKGRPLVIRTVDLGADKYTQSRAEIPERNPFLGCRSIRLCLRSLPMFKRQLRALLRASALGPMRIMFPLITSVGEFRQAKHLLHDVMEDLSEERTPFDAKLGVGMMVEVPSAALMADHLAREADFLSIGSNDLVQYTLAVDRSNERVANLYSPTHPAVIRLIRGVIQAARRRRKPVSCCGEAAGDPEYAMLLIGFGLRTLSVSAGSIPALKRLVRSVRIGQCERIARHALSLDSDAQVGAYLRDQARQIIPETFDSRADE